MVYFKIIVYHFTWSVIIFYQATTTLIVKLWSKILLSGFMAVVVRSLHNFFLIYHHNDCRKSMGNFICKCSQSNWEMNNNIGHVYIALNFTNLAHTQKYRWLFTFCFQTDIAAVEEWFIRITLQQGLNIYTTEGTLLDKLRGKCQQIKVKWNS